MVVLVTTAARVPALPDRDHAETRHMDMTFIGWFGLLAPTGTPPAFSTMLYAEAINRKEDVHQLRFLGRSPTEQTLETG
jgi:hypothetical protein